jgi:hypothetical protein
MANIRFLIAFFFIIIPVSNALGGQIPVGDDAHGKFKYEDFQKPGTCHPCHVNIFEQWSQAMMSKAYQPPLG